MTAFSTPRVAESQIVPKKTIKMLEIIISNIFIVFFGTIWLSATLGVEKAVMVGFVPFVIGALLKAILGTAVLYAKALSSRK